VKALAQPQLVRSSPEGTLQRTTHGDRDVRLRYAGVKEAECLEQVRVTFDGMQIADGNSRAIDGPETQLLTQGGAFQARNVGPAIPAGTLIRGSAHRSEVDLTSS